MAVLDVSRLVRRRAHGRGKSPACTLVELPFRSITEPNLGLTSLCEALRRSGYECSLRYANLEFYRFVGGNIYRTLSELLPHEFLVGDLVFSHLIGPFGRLEAPELSRLRAGKSLHLARAPEWLSGEIPAIREQAARFVSTLVQALLDTPSRVFGFNLMFQSTPALAVARAIKQRDPSRMIAFGGAQCEGPMGHILHQKFDFVDFVCRGEGEQVIVELVNALGHAENEPRLLQELATIEGLLWRKNGETIVNGESARPTPFLDELPLPEYNEWFDQVRTQAPWLSPSDLSLPFETSRGCWYGEKNHCIFCGLNGNSMTHRSKSPARALLEIERLSKSGIANLYAVDNILPREYFKSLLNTLAEQRHGVSLFYEVKANLKHHQLDLMEKAGLQHIQPGIESLSTKSLQLMRKGVAAYQNVRLLKWCAELGINVEWNLLYGFPNETTDTLQEQADLIPLLTHLRPPTCGACHVRIDRFSPLFEAHSQWGATNVRPSPAYEQVYSMDTSELNQIAYHFEFDVARPTGWEAAVEVVVERLGRWHEDVGRSAFVGVQRNGDIVLFDRRTDLPNSDRRLSGTDRNIFLACDAGATPQEICRTLGLDSGVVASCLQVMMDDGILAHLDGRYLSLATLLRDEQARGVPDSLLAAFCVAFARQRMLAFWGPLKNSLEQPSSPLESGVNSFHT